MGGGLMQIVSYGAQDEYLTGEPDITFFKMVYKKHANFAMESIEQSLNINGNIATCDVQRDGDLILNCWIECENGDDSVHRNGHELVKQVDFLIGGQVIDTHYGQWYDIWSQLSLHRKKFVGYNELINKYENSSKKAYIPLNFFFCKSHGHALPLIALKYHEVSLRITFADNVKNQKLFVDYVYLEQEERIRFAQMTHTILIEQLQYSGQPDLSDRGNKYLNFSHPVKELIWKYSDLPLEDSEVTIKFNEYNKISNRESMYFTHIQPYQHHTNIPSKDSGIYVYSFALKPEDFQPSGTCNFSRLKTSQIISTKTNTNGQKENKVGIEVYAINYNVLKITSGMAGLVFT